MKACKRCSVTKPLEEFYKLKRMADGTMGICKDCHRAAVRVLYMEKMKDEDWREQELARHRRKAAKFREEGRDSSKEIIQRSQAEWARRNKEKRAAHHAVGNAVRDGRLMKRPCEVCGNAQVEAHHEDYSKPLEVNWLCTRHHADRHLELNRQRRAEKYRQATQPQPAAR